MPGFPITSVKLYAVSSFERIFIFDGGLADWAAGWRRGIGEGTAWVRGAPAVLTPIARFDIAGHGRVAGRGAVAAGAGSQLRICRVSQR